MKTIILVLLAILPSCKSVKEKDSDLTSISRQERAKVVDKYRVISKDLYIETRDLSQKILSKFDNSSFLYLFLGRSCVGLQALFEELNMNARNLPISGFKFGQGNIPPLSEKDQKLLFQHFEKIILDNL